MIPHLKTIYTIGHSTHEWIEFLKMLQSFDIKMVADVRRFPSSRKFPQFNQEILRVELENNGIQYIHIEDLGGRRKAKENSQNTIWKNASFRGYADYMETEQFANAINQLEILALKQSTVYMCSEAVWWRCHRSMISDYLKAKSWKVLHIMNVSKSQEHPYTAPARIIDDCVIYTEENKIIPKTNIK